MLRELDKRLRKLESRVPRRPTENETIRRSLELLLVSAIGYYLGDPNPREAPIAAYARALGYEHGDLLRVLKEINSGHKDPNYNERHRLAIRRLFSKFGVNFDEAKNGEDVEAFKRMYAGLPEKDEEKWRTLFPNSQQTSSSA
jgi:hypothetical protein